MSNCGCNCGCGLPRIKQGDQYYLMATIRYNGVPLGAAHIPLIDKLEFTFEDGWRILLDPAESWYGILGKWLIPIDQQNTLLLGDGRTTLDLRVKFKSDDVIGAKRMAKLKVKEANSAEVI